MLFDPFESESPCHDVVTTRSKLAPAAFSASSCEWAYRRIVRLASLCPIHAAITATGTPDRCINVAQVCRAACNLIWRMPASFTASRQYRDSTPGAYGSPISLLTTYSPER